MKDLRGEELKAGDVIIYPFRHGHNSVKIKVILFEKEVKNGFSCYVAEDSKYDFLIELRKTIVRTNSECLKIDDFSFLPDILVKQIEEKRSEFIKNN